MGAENFTDFFSENNEGINDHFSYYNNELPDHPVVFVCQAQSKEKADEQFEKRMGKKPIESEHIGCTIINNKLQ